MALLVGSTRARAEPTLNLEVEPESVEVAEPVRLKIEVDGAGEAQWPDWAAALPDWNVVVDEVTVRSAALTLTSYLPGEVEVPAIEVRVTDRDTDPPEHTTLWTPVRTVAVASVLSTDVDLRSADALRAEAGAIAGPSRTALVWLGWVGGAAILVGTALVVRGRVKRSALKPEAEARRRIEAGDEPDVVLRHYLSGRFGLAAARQTPREFTEDSEARKVLEPDLHQRTAEFLRQAEAARFGAAGAGVDLTEEALKLIHRADPAHRPTLPEGSDRR